MQQGEDDVEVEEEELRNMYAEDNLRLLAQLGLYEDPEVQRRREEAAERKRLADERKEQRRLERLASGSDARKSLRLSGVKIDSYKQLPMHVVDDDDERGWVVDNDGDGEYFRQRRKRGNVQVGFHKTSYVPRGKEVYSEEHLAALGDCKDIYPFMGEEKTYDPVNGTCCHQCRQKTIDSKVHCSRCPAIGSYFCGTCLQARYGENKLEVFETMDTWLCPRCRGFCNCSMCRNEAGYGPSGVLAPLARKLGYKSAAHYLVMTNLFDSETGQKYCLAPDGTRTDLEVIERRAREEEPLQEKDEEEVAAVAAAAKGEAQDPGKNVGEPIVTPTPAYPQKKARGPDVAPTTSAGRGKKRTAAAAAAATTAATASPPEAGTARKHLALSPAPSSGEESTELPAEKLDDTLTVLSWGQVRDTEWFYTDEFVLPLNWKVLSTPPSLKETFQCQIVEHEGKPLFLLQSMQLAGAKRYAGANPSAAFAALLHGRGFQDADRMVDGMEFFGLLHPKVQERLGSDEVTKALVGTGKCLYGSAKRPKIRWQLQKGDLVAMRTPLDERDRFWIGRVIKAHSIPWDSSKSKTSLVVQWFDREKAAKQRYKLLETQDTISPAAIFAAKFDHLTKLRTNGTLDLLHDLQCLDL